MTKLEIELNNLKVGEIIEDADGGLWMVSYFDRDNPPRSAIRKLNEKDIICNYYCDVQEFSLVERISNPRRIHTLEWNILLSAFQNRVNFFTRSWKTLPAKRKVKIEVEIAEGVTEIEIEGKMVRV